MWSFDAASSYVLVVGLVTLSMLILVLRRQKIQKTIGWLTPSVVGLLLGSVGSYATVNLAGYELTERSVISSEEAGENTDNTTAMAGMGGGMFGGGRRPSPKRDLTALVRKLELLTDEISITLSDEKADSLVKAIVGMENGDRMTDEEAEAKSSAILGVLDDDQKNQLEKIRLPRPQRGRSGGGPGMRGPGGSTPDPDANPFQQERNAAALSDLRQRLTRSES